MAITEMKRYKFYSVHTIVMLAIVPLSHIYHFFVYLKLILYLSFNRKQIKNDDLVNHKR